MAEREWNLTDAYAKIISFGTNTETLTGNKTLNFNDRRVQFLDPGGSDRDVILPDETKSDGIIFWIANTSDSTSILVIYASDGITQKAYLTGLQSCFVMCDGTVWTAGSVGSGTHGTDVPTGASMWFNQNTAPIGWTIDESVADELLAVKGGAQAYNVVGGNSAGTWTQPDHTLTEAEMPAHVHDDHYRNVSYGGWCGYCNGPYPGGLLTTDTGTAGGGNAHNHGTTYRPKARVGIVCTKD